MHKIISVCLTLLTSTLFIAHTKSTATTLTYDPSDIWDDQDFKTISSGDVNNYFHLKTIESSSSHTVAQGFIATDTQDVSKISFLAHRLDVDRTIAFALYELLPNEGSYGGNYGANANKYRLDNNNYAQLEWQSGSITITDGNKITNAALGEAHFSLTDPDDGVLFSIVEGKHYAINVFTTETGPNERVTLWNYHDAGSGNEAAYSDGRYGVPNQNTVQHRDLAFGMTYHTITIPELNTGGLILTLMTLGSLVTTRRSTRYSIMSNRP